MKSKSPFETIALRSIILAAAFIGIAFVMVNCSNRSEKSGQSHEQAFVPDSIYINAGNKIVAHTFDTLRSSLLQTITSQGFPGAITFCSEKAYTITGAHTDSVTVRRTALRYRNPDNRPDSLELTVLNAMDAQVKSAKSAVVHLVRNSSSSEIHFFKPIMLQPVCLNCHGDPAKQIQPATLSRIRELYPEDQATNFKEGDLRGVWHIVFKSQKEL
jgi:hypothetical protein